MHAHIIYIIYVVYIIYIYHIFIHLSVNEPLRWITSVLFHVIELFI